MTRDSGSRRRGRLDGSIIACSRAERRLARTPVLESLEDRQLLSSFYAGPTPIRPVQGPGGMYTLTMTGPGFEKVKHLKGGAVAITAFGTTAQSSLDISLTRPRLHAQVASLPVASIRVASGTIGAITGGAATLLGPISPLNGQVNTLEFASLGANAQIDVGGSLGNLAVGSVNLGPGGHVKIGGDLGQSLAVSGSLAVNGGQFLIGHDLSGSLKAGSVVLVHGGAFVVGHDVTGSAQVGGDFDVNNGGVFAVGNNLGGLSVGRNLSLDTSGQVGVGNDLTGAVSVGGGLQISNKGRLSFGRDITGTVTVDGDLRLASNGTVTVGRNVNTLTVNGNLNVDPTGGALTVGGGLNNLTINGAFVGKGARSPADLTVGLNLGSFNVLGGGADQGGLQNASVDIGKSLLGLNIAHGIFNSFVTAGVEINGAGASGGSGNIGPDGADGVVNSDIRAGVKIDNLTIAGNVRSTFASNPSSTGYPTRIVAGEDRAGNFSSGGVIDNFQITGALIDSVLAASVAPGVGDGTLPPTGYGPPRIAPPHPTGTYDAPAGNITGGTVGSPVQYANFAIVNVYNEMVTGTAYLTANPTLFILPGAINPSFASAPLTQAALTTTSTVTNTNSGTQSNQVTTNSGSSTQATSQTNNGSATTTTVTPSEQVLPLPTKSTVLGGVISTAQGTANDHAGLFAADARGVFVGALPS